MARKPKKVDAPNKLENEQAAWRQRVAQQAELCERWNIADAIGGTF